MGRFVTISYYITRTLSIVSQKKANGENVYELQIVEKCYELVTFKFECIVSIIEESKNFSYDVK